MLIDSSRLVVLAFGWRRSRELVCHIDYLLLMRAKIARNASSSIDGTYLALSLLYPEHVFLLIEVCAFLSVVVCQPGRWLPTLALVLCWYYWATELFLCWLTLPAPDFSFRMKKEQGVGHIDCLLLMRAKIARNASSSIDRTDLALSLFHPERVFLWIEVCAFLSVVVCQPGRWLPTLALVLCW